MAINVVGSAGGTTNFDVAYFNEIFVGGTISGSYFDPACSVSDTAGTFIGSRIDNTLLNVKGTLTGSVANLTTVGLLGTLSGGVVNGTIMNAAQYVGSRADVKGTVTGSFIKGTFAGDFLGSTINRADMLASSGTIQVGATPGTFVHGLGAAPSFVSIVPINALQGATGTEGNTPFYNAAPDATAVYVQAGTTGTCWVYALA